MDKDIKLLPCPFCGHRATGPGFNANLWWISCTHCQCEMGLGVESTLVADWNHRALSAIEQREGWIMVPKEPTRKMLEAGGAAIWGHANDAKEALMRNAYKAMLAAAEPPAALGKD
jgi:hypothetical protein